MVQLRFYIHVGGMFFFITAYIYIIFVLLVFKCHIA